MSFGRFTSRRAALSASISMLSLMLATGAALAQSTDAGSVDVQAGRGLPPLTSRAAVGSQAPAGTAPALAPVQGSLDAIEPTSIVSDKVLRDVIPPTSDFTETVKYTPGWQGSNVNGLLGDSKGGWRGFADGQYNVTFDGIPFGDENDPTHHSAAYFPAAFLSSVVVDRGPGPASQAGFATFGGTLALNSTELKDNFGGTISGSIGSFNTQNTTVTLQTGKIAGSEARAVIQYSNSLTYGALQYGKYYQNQFLGKAQDKFGDFTVTLLTTYGTENYNNVTSITYPQYLAYGKRYGAVNSNPLSQEYIGFNNSQKRTDLEYLDIDGTIHGFHLDNKIYSYAYDYPTYQNNGVNQSGVGNATSGNKGTVGSTVTYPNGKVTAGDVLGYIKFNNYRAIGDTFKAETLVDAGMFSGLLRLGMWYESGSNDRLQEYIDYTTGVTYPQLGATNAQSYKLLLTSKITTFQPYVEYEWAPIDGLTITPGYKFISFTRDHQATVNQTTLTPLYYSHTYTSSLPYLSANYRLTNNISVYAQASNGYLVPTVSAYYVANPALDNIRPQTTDNLQAGAVYKSEKITADIDVYRIKAYNYAVTQTIGGSTFYTNGGAVQFQGVEAEGSYVFAPGWSAYASVAFISAQSTSTHLRVGDAPRYTTSFGAVFDNGKFFGSALERVVGDFYGSAGETVSTATASKSLNFVKGYSTTDIVVGVRGRELQDAGYLKNVTLRAGIYNLFDNRTTSSIGGSPNTLTITDPKNSLTYTWLPGRTIFGTVTIGF